MTAIDQTMVPISPDSSVARVTQARVVRAEWTKLWSVRSSSWTVLAAAAALIGIGAIFCAVTNHEWSRAAASDRAGFDPVTASLAGVTFAQLAVGVLGVLLMSGEYGTGAARAAFAIVPRRLPVLWGKLAVFSAVSLVSSTVAAVTAFLLGQRLLHSTHVAVGFGHPDVARSVFGAALYLTVAGIIGLAIGTLLRNTAAAISTFVAVFFVLPPLAGLLPASVDNHIRPYLPGAAGTALWSPGPHSLAPWAGFALFCGYAAVLLAAAAWRLRRTDV